MKRNEVPNIVKHMATAPLVLKLPAAARVPQLLSSDTRQIVDTVTATKYRDETVINGVKTCLSSCVYKTLNFGSFKFLFIFG